MIGLWETRMSKHLDRETHASSHADIREGAYKPRHPASSVYLHGNVIICEGYLDAGYLRH